MPIDLSKLSLEQLERATQLRQQIEALKQELDAIGVGEETDDEVAPKPTGKKRGPKGMSAEARARISAAQKARWAKQRGETADSDVTETQASAAPAAKAGKAKGKGKSRLSAEGKAKIIAATKAYWEKKRKGLL